MNKGQIPRLEMDSNNEKEQASVKKRVRRERRQLVAGELVQDFAQNTTLHGLRYIAEKRLSLVEKIFWTVSFVTSVSLCLMLIWNVWVKWQSAPIIVTVDDDYVSIQEVPFPSVTICPHSKLKKSVCSDDDYDLMQYKYHSDVDDTEDSMLYEAVCLILGLPNEMTPKPFNVRIVEKIFEVSPNIDDILHSCNLYGSIGDCKELFNPVLTMEGVCFTMNSLAANEILRNNSIQNNYTYLGASQQSVGWSQSGGYSRLDSSDDVFPKPGRRSTYSRPDASIILKHENEDVSRFYNTNNDGFKVFLHHPADLPQSSVFFYAAPNEQRISLGLKLSITNTSSSLRTYAADTRRCYFPGERELRYFHTYTDNNCKLECLSNYTLQLCGCVWFHMPHNNASTVCRINYEDMFCFQRAVVQYDEREGDYNRGGQCRCYPLCLNIQYEADFVKILRYDSNQRLLRDSMPNTTDLSQFKFTRIEMFYKTPKIVPMRRSELFGMTDFFANCGGLLGLFLGFSFLSILEIVYFCTLRLGCSFRRNTQPAENTTQKDEKRFDSSVSLNMLQAENITEKDEERDGSSLCQNAQQLENNTQTDEERLGGSPCLNTQQIEKNTEKNEEPY